MGHVFNGNYLVLGKTVYVSVVSFELKATVLTLARTEIIPCDFPTRIGSWRLTPSLQGPIDAAHSAYKAERSFPDGRSGHTRRPKNLLV